MLPFEEFELCQLLQARLGPNDGFRRKAVPPLLYRYFSGMQETFKSLRSQLKAKAPFALIVGHNHTILGGVRHDLDTPRHLASLATHTGWQLEEIIELQTYRRYGYHVENAVSSESSDFASKPMNELTLHPNIYKTGHNKGLISLLERLWVRDHTVGQGTFYIVSGFANYNGGVRFYDTFRSHIDKGGKVVAILGGSTSQRLTSRQVVAELLSAGAEVHIINRKRLMHAKSYGTHCADGQMIVVTSGNFTGPGMSQNVEMALLLDRPTTKSLAFSWEEMVKSMLAQKWDFYRPDLANTGSPAWQLLYDEEAADIKLDDTDEVTMILKLSHADTVRIMADLGTDAGRGSQYFWLSKNSFDFLPPLTILNRRGYKTTYSCLVDVDFIDVGKVQQVRATFEAENNLDFRLGTGPLRHTKLAAKDDISAITRVGEDKYELRLYRAGAALYETLAPYAVTFIGHQGKKYGFLPNTEFYGAIGAGATAKLH